MKKWIKKVSALALAVTVIVTSFHCPWLVSATDENSDFVKEYTFETIDDVTENFVSYYAPNDKYIEGTNEDGSSAFTVCDAASTWRVDNGELVRYGAGSYAGGSRRYGPALLYTKERYEDFSAEFDYNVGTSTGWRWLAFGFGATEYGKTYIDDNYMAIVEGEGYIQLFNKSANATKIYGALETAFTTARNNKQWIHVKVSVMAGKLTVSYTYTDETTLEERIVTAQRELTDYTGGYLYLHCFSQNMRFRNLKISRCKTIEQISDGGRILTSRGTNFEKLELPKVLTGICTDGTEAEVNVTWKQGNYDATQEGLYKIVGTVSVDESKYVLNKDISDVVYYVEVGNYDPRFTQSFHVLSTEDLNDYFTCYSVPKDSALNAIDEKGNALLEKSDVTSFWQIDSETNGIIRKGTGDNAAGAESKGASLLYFKDLYEDFEVELEYCFSESYSNYRWLGLGFGAPYVGNTYFNDSYFALVEREGTVKILSATDNMPNTALLPNKTAVETYKEQVMTNPANYRDVWHTAKYTVSNHKVSVTFDGNGPYTSTIPNYTDGYVYLYSSTQGMKFRNIKVTNLQTGSLETDVLPTKYEVENSISGAVSNIVTSDEMFRFDTLLKGENIPIKVTFPMKEGIRVGSTRTGFFESEELRKITYTTSDGKVTAVAGQEKVVLTYSPNGWTLDFYNGNVKKTSLSSENIQFGFVGEEVKKIKFSFAANENEKFYGLGERFNAVYQNGYAVSLWNRDTGYHTSYSTNPEDYLESYANIPILHSTDNYTIFFNSTCAGTADICKTEANRFFFDFNEDIFDIYIWTNTVTENIQSYSALTGLPYVPEKWAFRYWAGGGSRVWGNSSSTEEEVLAVLNSFIDGYKSMGIDNLQALYGETPLTDYASAYNTLKNENIRALAWNRCSVPYSTMRGLLAGVGALPTITIGTDPNSYFGNENYTYIDYTHPNAVKLVSAQYRDKIKLGLSGLMVDMGEKIGEDTLFYNGMSGDEMHNLYSYYYAKTMNKAFTEQLGNDYVLFERSGSAGSSHYAAMFSGDQRSDWNGLNLQLRGLMSAASSGMPIYGGDIGGHAGTPSSENYMRWVEFSTFTPLMRAHGLNAEALNPWDFGKEAEAVFKKYYNFRDVILDTIYSSALNAGASGEPMTKTLAMYDSEDTALRGIEDEYIFCNAFLVAPVTQKGVSYRNVTLPNGKWYGLYDRTGYEGGGTVTAQAPEDMIPVYIKSGAVLPVSVSNNYDLFESGDISALLITAPEMAGSEIVYFSEKDTCEYTFKQVSPINFAVENDGNNKAVSVILHGYTAGRVIVDGVELTQASEGVGYSIDGFNTVIRMESAEWTRLEVYNNNSVKENRVTYVDLSSREALDKELVSFAVPGNQLIESVNNDGAHFKETPNNALWNIPASGILERNSEDTYKSENIRSRRGAAALYLPDVYTDFEMKFQYSYSGVQSGWRWVSVGVGAQQIGDSYYDSGYLALVESDGKVKVLGDKQNNGSITTYKVNDEAISGYGGEDGWHNATISVKGKKLTVIFDGNCYSYDLENYAGGYIYLHCFTEGIRFRDISVIDCSDQYVTKEALDNHFDAYRFTESGSPDGLGTPGFSAEYAACSVSDIFELTDSGLKRINGTNYANRKLAHLHYKEELSKFRFSCDYILANKSWDSVQVVFGADNASDSIYKSGFLVEVNNDGSFYLTYKKAGKEELSATKYTDTVSDSYQEKRANGEKIHLEVSLTGNMLCVEVDGKRVTIGMSSFATDGYLSFGVANSNIIVSNIVIQDVNAYNEIIMDSLSKGKLESSHQFAESGQVVKVKVAAKEGYLMKEGSLSYSYVDGEKLVVQRLQKDSTGEYTFTVPNHTGILSAVFYMPFDVNTDEKVNVKDLVRLRKYISSEKYSVDENAADTDNSGSIDTSDLRGVRMELLK